MSDEILRIQIDEIGGKNAANTLKNIADKTKEITELLKNVGYGSKEIDTLTKEFNKLANSIKVYSSAIRDVNKANTNAMLSEQKVAQALEKTNSVRIKNTAEIAKQELAQRKANTESAKESLIQQRIQTEINKTSIAELRLAQMQEKVTNAISKASMPLTTLNRNLKEQEMALKNAILLNKSTDNTLNKMASEYNRLSGEISRVNGKFNQLTFAQQTTLNVSQMLSRTIASFIGNLAAFTVQNAIYGIKDFAVSCSEAGVQLDSLRNTMMAATGGWEQGGREIKWLADISNRLGVEFGGASDSYSKFMVSFTRSGGTIEQSRQIFEDISTAMVNLHLPAERMQGVFVALEQMANKGTVQAEELKRQLSNALPGAFELAAESMGILPSKLMDMMKAGEVVSKDFLPNFAKTVKEVLGQGISIAVAQFNANMMRLKNSVTFLKMELGTGLNKALLPFVKGLANMTSALANVAKFFNENSKAAAFFNGALLGLTTTVIAFNFSSIIAGLSAITVGLKAVAGQLLFNIQYLALLNAELGGLPLLLGLVVTGITSLGFYLHDTAQKAGDVTPYMSMREQIVELSKSVTALDLNTQQGQKSLQEYKNQFPELTQYLLDTGKNFQDLTEKELENIAVLGQHDAVTRAYTEKVKELNSWQNTLNATWQVAWQSMTDSIRNAGKFIMSIIDTIVNKVKTVINAFNVFGSAIETLGQKSKIAPLELWGKSLQPQKWSNFAKNTRSEMIQTINGITKATGIYDKKVEIAQKNYEKKLRTIQEGSSTTVASLKSAQVAVRGIEEATVGKSGSKVLGSKSSRKTNGRNKVENPKTLTAWEELQKKIQTTEEMIRLKALEGQQIDDELTNRYKSLLEQQNKVNNAIRDLNLTPYEKLKNQVSELSKEYKNMMLNSSAYTKQQIDNTKKLLKQKESELNYTDAMKNRQNIVEITKRNAKELGDAFVDAIFDGSETSIQDKFKDIAKSFLKSIATDFSKKMLDSLTSGFALGFSNTSGNLLQRLLGGAVGGAGGLLGKSQNTVLGSIASATSGGGFSFKNAISGLMGQQTGTGVAQQQTGGVFGKIGGLFGKLGGMFSSNAGGNTGASGASTLMQNLASQGNILTQTLQSQVIPAASQTVGSIAQMSSPISTAINGLTGMVSPATNTANSLISMASSTPLAAVGMASMSASMTSLAPAASMAAPSLMQMGTALASIGGNASMAATSMAALAVATAANSAAQKPYAGWLLAPVAATLTGAAIAAGTIMTGGAIAASTTLAGAGQMLGGAMSGIGNTLSGGVGNIIPHAKGGVISSPTTFPMSGGNIGLAGEAGTEVIAPARRMSNGDLGVGAVAPNVTVNNYTNAAVEVIRRPNNETEVKITELNAMLSSSKTNRGFANAQSRMSQKGRQIG